MCMSGLFVAIELKTDKGKLSPLQDYNLRRIADAGGISVLMTPSNFGVLIKRLNDLSNGHKVHFKKEEMWK